MRNKQVKQKTRVAKIDSKESVVGKQLNGLPVAGQSMSEMLPKSQTSTSVSLDGVHTKRFTGTSLQQNRLFIPVIGMDRKPLMPTTPWRAARWIKSRKATPFWSKGIFCVRMNVPTEITKQSVACGIDPGSKKEGFTVKSAEHTYLNVNADAVTWVKYAVEVRRNMRRSRRFRKTPCRQPRLNRARGCLPPSTKARWQWKLRLANWLIKIYPIECFVVEDIKAHTHGGKRWNRSFSPLQVGKNWFYLELSKLGEVRTKQGYETKELRDNLSMKKTHKKLENVFSAHCVDSWVLANSYVGGDTIDNKILLLVTPLRFHRRQLQVLQSKVGGYRRFYGGTRSLGFRRGSIVMHHKYGKVYVGGTSNNRISLHSVESGERLCTNARVEDCRFLTFNSWRMVIPPTVKIVGSLTV